MKRPNRIRHTTGLASLAGMFLLLSLGNQFANADTPLLNFEFNETTTENVTDSINGLSGYPTDPAPTSITDTPSGDAADRAIEFAAGQFITVDDLDTRMQLDPADSSFTLQAWVKFSGNPGGRMVFFYNNGPGGAVSFSVNTDRTVFVTTLGILDASSQAVIPDDGEWHHIAVVHENGKEIRYYVDGVLGYTRPYTSGVIFTRTQTFFTLGSEPNSVLQYVGSLDRLKVSSGVIDAFNLDFRRVPVLNTPPSVATQPQDANVNEGEPVVFSATIDGSTPMTFQWFQDDAEIEGATGPSYSIDSATLALNGATFKCTATNPYGTITTTSATLTVVADTVAPELVDAWGNGAFNRVTVKFSEPVDAVTAQATANYSIAGLTISQATLSASDERLVTLTTSTQAEGTSYTLTVNSVKDQSTTGNVIAAGSQITFKSFELVPGFLTLEYYEGIGGTAVADLRASPKFPDSPDSSMLISSFDLPNGHGENYGARVTGFLIPTVTGNYDFFVRSDDASQLFVNTGQLNSNTTLPPNITDDRIGNLDFMCWEDGCCNPFYEPGVDDATTPFVSALTAGQKYAVVYLLKEGGGGDWGQAAWRISGDSTPAASLTPIPGTYLATYMDTSAELAFVSQPTDQQGNVPAPGDPMATQDFGTSDGGYTVVDSAAAPAGWLPWTYNATTGEWGAVGSDPNCGGPWNSRLTSPAYTVPEDGDVTLSFTHRYSFEGDYYDGGQVWVSVNGGDFTPVFADDFLANGYAPGNIIGNGVLNGKRAFNGDSPGYAEGQMITSTVILGSFNANDTVAVQFVGGWDDCWGPEGPGWFIQDLELLLGSARAVVFAAEAAASLHGDPVAVAYQWQRDDGTGFVNIAGATSASLRLIPSAADLNATFRVVATARDKSLASNGAKIVTEVVEDPTVAISTSGGTLTIEFTGTLQSATDVTGEFQDVPGATSPYTPASAGDRMFFRSVR